MAKAKEILSANLRQRLQAKREALEKVIGPARQDHEVIIAMRQDIENLNAEVKGFEEHGNCNDDAALTVAAAKQSKAKILARRIEQAEARLEKTFIDARNLLGDVDQLEREARMAYYAPHLERLTDAIAEFYFERARAANAASQADLLQIYWRGAGGYGQRSDAIGAASDAIKALDDLLAGKDPVDFAGIHARNAQDRAKAEARHAEAVKEAEAENAERAGEPPTQPDSAAIKTALDGQTAQAVS